MTKISKSPERHTFQSENYVKRCEEEGKEPSEDYLELYKSARQRDEENMIDPEWQKDNMEYDLRSTDWILEKVRASESYAQNLYAAMCNNDFVKREMWPILKDQRWSRSWRSAGGVIADMREQGDYIDWYCSGIRNDTNYDPELDIAFPNGYVPESVVTEEIENDLYKLGWLVVKYDDTKDS
jgi:hypothetical protein